MMFGAQAVEGDVKLHRADTLASARSTLRTLSTLCHSNLRALPDVIKLQIEKCV